MLLVPAASIPHQAAVAQCQVQQEVGIQLLQCCFKLLLLKGRALDAHKAAKQNAIE